MIPFNNIKYERIDYIKTKEKLNNLINKLKLSKEVDETIKIIKNIITIQNTIEEMYDYADIRNMRDINDAFFNNEIDYWNEYKPKFDSLFIPFYEICLKSNYKKTLRDFIPLNFFLTIEYKSKLLSDDILKLQKRENELKKEYRSITREKIKYNNEFVNLSSVVTDLSNSDRKIRKNAHDVYNDFFLSKKEELDNLIFELVSTRNEIAKKLGFDNYSTYSLYDLRRFGYDYTDIKKFRDSINKYISPLCRKINEWKKKELNIDELKYYDTTIYFKDMPKPLYKGNDLLVNLNSSIKKLDKGFYEFYKTMLNNGYIDLETRNNKINYSITNYLSLSAFPTITGNFKNSYLDVFTTFHELGHAYQKYNASIKDKDYIVSSLLKYPTFEIAEIFSHAMELISMDYVSNIFSKNDYQKYCTMAIIDIIESLSHICLVDEFQERIYKLETLTKEDICATWIECSKKYGLEIKNKGHKNLDNGGYFYRQSHIFLNPFYYIDYALSYFGTIALWSKCKSDLSTFKEMGSVASYYPFKMLVDIYKLPNPFDESSIKETIEFLENELEKYKK